MATFNMIHVHKLGNWVVMRQPTPEEEGMERADCSGCDYYEERQIANIPAVCYITIDLGNGQTQKIGVGSNGIYRLSDPTRIGFNFKEFVDGNGKPFAASGTTSKNISIAAVWEIDGTDTLEELLERADLGATDILITADIIVDQPIFVPYVTKIYSDGDFSIIRAPKYEGDIFVLGRNSKNESSVVNHHQACLTLGGGKGTLTIDGNRDNTIITVKGSLIYAGDSSLLKIYDGVRLVNNEKLGNKRALETGTKSTGGAAIAIYNSTVWMYGGVIDNCAVATTVTQVVNEDGTVSNHEYNGYGGAIYVVYANGENNEKLGTVLNMTGGSFVDNSALSGGSIAGRTNSAITLTGVVVDGNASTFVQDPSAYDSSKGGGAIFCNNSQLTLSGCELTGNSSAYYGGAIKVTEFNVTVKDDTVISGSTGATGAALHIMGSLNVDGLILTNNTSSANGVIYLNGAQMNISGLTATGNSAEWNGGVLYISGGKTNVTVTDSSFEGNTAPSGGAVWIGGGSLTMNGVNLVSNTATNGGAIHAVAGMVTLDGCTVSKNTATKEGGAVYSTGAVINTVNGSFAENTAGNGGAIYLYACELSGENNNFTSNSATGHGGAIYVNYNKTTVEEQTVYVPGVLTLTGGAFEENTALAGGAVSVRSHSTATFTGTTFIGNSVTGYADTNDGDGDGGGAIYVGFGEVTLNNVTASGNSAESYGGVVDAYNATVNISGGVYQNNVAGIGGGVIYAPANCDVIVQNATFTGNKTTDKTVKNHVGGGVIQIVKGDLTISGSTFSGNTSAYYGGALLAGNSTVTINGNTSITGSSGSTGAALYFKDACTATLENVDISNNTAKGNGVVYTNSGILNMSNVTAKGNTSYNGGVLYVSGSSTRVTVEEFEFSSNKATNTGGAIHLVNGKVTLLSGTMTDNMAGNGGAIYNSNGTVETTDVAFNENKATGDRGGGAIAVEGGSVTLSAGTTFTGNTATANGGAIYSVGANISTVGGSFESNTAVDGGAIYAEDATMTATKSVTLDGSAEETELVFANTYKTGTANVVFGGDKTLNGRVMIDGEFMFLLKDADGKVIGTATNKDGKFVFDAVEFTKAGTYVFYIEEDATDPVPGVTYDKTSHKITVVVTDDGLGNLIASVNGKTANTANVKFTNTFTPDDVRVPIMIQKILENKTGTKIGLDGFRFILTDGKDFTQELVSDKDGKAGLTLTFGPEDAGKTFTFYLSEEDMGATGMTYDEMVYEIKIAITRDEVTGELTASVTRDGKTATDAATFTNTYFVEEPPKTSDPMNLEMVVGLTAFCAMASTMMLAVLLLTDRKARRKADK